MRSPCSREQEQLTPTTRDQREVKACNLQPEGTCCVGMGVRVGMGVEGLDAAAYKL